jgi:hypothetical protein
LPLWLRQTSALLFLLSLFFLFHRYENLFFLTGIAGGRCGMIRGIAIIVKGKKRPRERRRERRNGKRGRAVTVTVTVVVAVTVRGRERGRGRGRGRTAV